jgi:hypothetical protein
MSISHFDPKQTSTRRTSASLLALALPSEGSYHSLAGIDRADLFSRSNAQLVAVQLEVSHLFLPGKKFIPRHVDLGRKLVPVYCEFTGVSKKRLEESGRLPIVCRWFAICPYYDKDHVPVRRKDRPAFRIGTEWFCGLSTDNLNGP